ncbi:MAG: diacylglycerol kinase [Actinobacteria bacterium]|nr:MAG: diacylglycerol kinase [Actinomycetota bacterium]
MREVATVVGLPAPVPPRRPFLIMNPQSGGGKVDRFGLVRKARALNADVALLEGAGTVDVAALAREAADDGADLLGVAGGDGTQSLVAAVAADRGIPFMVIAAGTRNQFARDLGLDSEDPAACLAALTDGVEVRVDLGRIGDRSFVTSAAFGAYAELVRTTAFRDGDTAAALALLPSLLAAPDEQRLNLRTGDTVVGDSAAVLVSNNPYGAADIAGLGRRNRLDRGVLGLLAVTLRGARDAVRLVRGRRSGLVKVSTATEAVIETDADRIPVGVDGEEVTLATPVHCAIRPGVLRVRVPRLRPGVRPGVRGTRVHTAMVGT